MLRLLVSPKWIAWHVLTLGAMATCGFLAAWQWHRAGSALGSAVNIGYGLQWPIFAVFFAVMWWRFLRMEVRALNGPPDSSDDAAPEAATPAGTAAGTAPRPGDPRGAPVPVGAPDAAGSRSGGDSSPGARFPPATTTGAGAGSAPEDSRPPRTDDGAAAAVDDHPSPFTPRPAGVGLSTLSDPQIRAYNQALAELSARERES